MRLPAAFLIYIVLARLGLRPPVVEPGKSRRYRAKSREKGRTSMLKSTMALAIGLTTGLTLASIAPGCIVAQQSAKPPVPLEQRIAHADPSKYRHMPAVHNGPGALDYMPLFDAESLDTNLFFMHRGMIEPKSGIGAHFHNQCEEMFVILDGEAQFTIDGRTSVLKGPAGAPSRLGHSHAIYNATDKPVQWINFNVGTMKGVYDAFNLDDPRVDVPLDPIPTFITMHLDRSLLKPVDHMDGGTGTVQYRRVLDPTSFTPHGRMSTICFCLPGTTIGPSAKPSMSEIYYVMAGDGSVTIGSETAQIHSGDAVPVRVNENLVIFQLWQRTARVHDLRNRQRHGRQTSAHGDRTQESLGCELSNRT
jgi:mannose-6-phosphate isomerase-like protein (cupin superfamily)